MDKKLRIGCMAAILMVPVMVLWATDATAHIIVLKDGQRLQTDKVWEDGGFIKYRIPGGSLGVRRGTVDEIIYEKEDTPSQPRPASSVEDLKTRLVESVKPRNPIETAVLATVSIISPVSTASGFFISRNGYILTNKHVVRMDRQNLDKMASLIDEKKRWVARMDRQLKRRRKRLGTDEQWLARTRQELAAMRDKRVFPTKRLAGNHIEATAALTRTFNARLDGYYARHDQYEGWLREFNGHKQKLDEAMGVYEDLVLKASGREKPYIVLADGTRMDVAIVAESKDYDVALLKLDGYRTPFLVPEHPDNIAVSDPVYAIGNPTGEFHHTVSAGTLKNIIAPGVLSGQKGAFLQNDAKIYPGNSGGPLVDNQGRVIGINTMKEVTRKFEGLGFALSIRIALDEFRDILPSSGD